MPNFISRPEQNVVEELQEFSNVGPFGGVQSEVPLDQVEQFGQVDIFNMSLRKSVAETRSGYTILPPYPAPANEDTTGIADFYTKNAARIQVVMTLTRLIKWDATTQNWVVITGTLTGGPFDLFTWTVVNDTLCFCQGIDPIQIWDGITGTFGPAAPGVITAAVVNVGGTGFVVGDTFTIPGGNGFASFTVLTVSGTTVLTFAITNPGVGYTTGTGIAATATSGVGTGLTINVTTVITASYPAKYLMELGTHLVASYTIEGGTPHTQRVRWSGAGDPTDFTSFSSGINDILGDLGPITGAVKIFQTGYIFHQWGVTQMIPTGVGTNPFQFVPLTTRARGNTVPYSLAPAGEEFACYIGKDNVYKFNGTNSEPIGDRPMSNNKRFGARSRIFLDLKATDPRSVVGYISDTINGQVFPAYWLMMPNVNGTTIIWIYNLDEQNWARFTFTGFISTIGRFFQDLFTRWQDLIGTWADQTLDWDQFAGINPLDSVLLAFNNGVDGNFDFSSVSEQAFGMSGVFLMGDVRHSKTIKKFRVSILDNGPVTFTVALSNAVGQTVSQTVTMGTSSGKNISQILTLSITGIRISYSITGAAGQDLTLVEFAPMYSIAGEQRGGSVDA
jgi:hypothetical protein